MRRGELRKERRRQHERCDAPIDERVQSWKQPRSGRGSGQARHIRRRSGSADWHRAGHCAGSGRARFLQPSACWAPPGDVKRANEGQDLYNAQATGFRSTLCHSPALGGRSPCSSCDSSSPSPPCTRVRARVRVRERVRMRVGSPRVGVRARAVARVTPHEVPRCAVRTVRPRRVCASRTHRACGLG